MSKQLSETLAVTPADRLYHSASGSQFMCPRCHESSQASSNAAFARRGHGHVRNRESSCRNFSTSW